MAKTKLEINVREIGIDELLPDARNANRHTDKGRALVGKSIRELGAGRSVLTDKDGTLIAGNLTAETARAAGITKAIVVQTTGDTLVVVERTDLDLNSTDDPRARQMALVDNSASLLGIHFDFEVAGEIGEEFGFDIGDWGIDIPVETVAPEVEEDEAPGVPSFSVTVKGDVWELISEGKKLRHRVMCGDSTDSDAVAALMEGQKADFVFTSPPYNGNTTVGFEREQGTKGTPSKPLYRENSTDDKTSEEYIQFNADIFNTIKTIASDDLVILYNINYNRNSPSEYIDVVNVAREAFSLVETIVWKKRMVISLAGDNLTRIFEFVFVLYNGDDKPKMYKADSHECINNFWEVNNVGANHEEHKACFPIELVAKGLLLYSKEGCFVFEPFTGSGTTLIACEQLSRHCRGMELDEKYCDVIVRRWINWIEKDGSKYTILLNGQVAPGKVEQLLGQGAKDESGEEG